MRVKRQPYIRPCQREHSLLINGPWSLIYRLGCARPPVTLERRIGGLGRIRKSRRDCSSKTYAYGAGSLQVVSSIDGLEQQDTLGYVYYAPGVHVRLVSLGKLEGQGWDIRRRMVP